MITIPLQAVPAQSFHTTLDNNDWQIELITANDVVCATLTKNSTLLIENIRVVAGYQIIPYRYLEEGNFALITTNFEIPDYTKFGVTQQLVYASQEEIDTARLSNLRNQTFITAANFDPNAALPLRFAPKGYVLV